MIEIFKLKKRIIGFILGLALVTTLAGVVYAAFSDKGKVLGSSFSVGNADLKLFSDVSRGAETENLVDELNGPTFTNIGQSWQQDYLVRIYNNGTYEMDIASHANYETANDPDDLRQYIYAEIFPWDDANSDNQLTSDELGESFGKKTIIKWKTEGFSFTPIGPGAVLSLVIRFSTDSLPDTKQGTQGIFDFEFDSIEK